MLHTPIQWMAVWFLVHWLNQRRRGGEPEPFLAMCGICGCIGPLKMQVRSQYLKSDSIEKVWKVPGIWPAGLSGLLSTNWSDLVSTAPRCYNDQYYLARRGEASCSEPTVAVIHSMTSKQTYSSSSEKEKHSHDKCKVWFHDVGGGGALMLNF